MRNRWMYDCIKTNTYKSEAPALFTPALVASFSTTDKKDIIRDVTINNNPNIIINKKTFQHQLFHQLVLFHSHLEATGPGWRARSLSGCGRQCGRWWQAWWCNQCGRWRGWRTGPGRMGWVHNRPSWRPVGQDLYWTRRWPGWTGWPGTLSTLWFSLTWRQEAPRWAEPHPGSAGPEPEIHMIIHLTGCWFRTSNYQTTLPTIQRVDSDCLNFFKFLHFYIPFFINACVGGMHQSNLTGFHTKTWTENHVLIQ